MEILTGFVGRPHITSEKVRAENQGIFGEESVVLSVGQKLRAEIATNSEIKIRDGALSLQGCIGTIKKNTYDSVRIENGSQGMKRKDLIVCRYQRNPDTATESLAFRVVKGSPTSGTPRAGTYVIGDIQGGDLVAEMPLYEVDLNGINIVSVVPVFKIVSSVKEVEKIALKANSWEAYRESFIGTKVYRLNFGGLYSGKIESNEVAIPWLPGEVSVSLRKLEVPGKGVVPNDYKGAYLSEHGGLYIYCSTNGANGAENLKWETVDATIHISKR